MRLRKIMIILMSLCIISGLMSGCGDSKDKEKADKVNTTIIGKYVEENVEVPFKQNETVLRLLKNIKGNMEIYTRGDDGTYKKYISLDGKEWKEEDASWLSQISQGKVVSLSAGRDGNYYAIVIDENSKKHLLKQTGEGTGEEIRIPELNESNDEVGSEFYSFGTELKVMENGNLVLEGDREIKVYTQADGELLYSLLYEKSSTDARNPVDVNGENIILPSKDNIGFTVWNGEEEKASLTFGSDVRYGRVVLEDNNEIYFINKDGIHHMQPEGTLVETLADGDTMTMGLPGVFAVDFVKGEEEDFYALYKMNNGKMSVKHYFYNENVKVDSDKILHIYSLEENNTVRQAVSIFSQKYPQIEISYMTGESDSSTRADKIRVLNTELLNKSGADVLILDDLPIDSLIEKGVLKDISSIITPLIEDGTLRDNIADCYIQENKKIYTMPVKYGIPILYGDQENIDAMSNLDTLENWLDIHENVPFFTYVTYDELTRLFINMYYNELFDEAGKLKQDKLEQCLSCVKKAGGRVQAEIERSYASLTEAEIEEISSLYISDWQAGNSIGVMEERQVASDELRSIIDMMEPFTIMRENNLPILLNKEIFIPHGLTGINSASSVTELAEEFIKILFSKEVQEYNLGDGFPMNQSADAGLIELGMNNLEEQEKGSLISVGGTEDGSTYSFGMPLKTEIKELLEKIKELKKPAGADRVLLDMIFEEAKMYYGGNQEVEETVQKITAKVDTYFAE